MRFEYNTELQKLTDKERKHLIKKADLIKKNADKIIEELNCKYTDDTTKDINDYMTNIDNVVYEWKVNYLPF